MRELLSRAVRDENGQDLIEYALLAAFISIIAVVAITDIGSSVNNWYTGFDATIDTIPTGAGS